MKIQLKHKSCPICNNNRYAHYCFARDDGYFERNNIPQKKVRFEIVQCSSCSMVFVKNPLNSTRYKEPENLDYSISRALIKSRHYYLLSYIHWFKKLLGRNPLVLEVGCGFGELYRLATKAGYNYSVIEPSPLRAKFIRDLGLEIFEGTIEEYINKTTNKKFDIIILDNVIEHIPYPNKVIAEIKPLLTNGGFLILVAPNLFDLRRYLMPGWGKKQIMPVGHVNYFSPKTLKMLLENNGFIALSPLLPKGEMPIFLYCLVKLKLLVEKILGVFPLGLYICGHLRNKEN